jgi:1-acyl-sn-glycerol-3-phosphate acyltransferase
LLASDNYQSKIVNCHILPVIIEFSQRIKRAIIKDNAMDIRVEPAETIDGKANTPALGTAVPQRHRPLRRLVCRHILHWTGWRFEGSLANIPKFLAVGAPHTSNWDLIMAVLCIYALGIDMSWMGKHTLFRRPYGWLFRRLGGIPVDRRAPRGTVGQMADVFKRREQVIVGIAPEGTRSKVREWKSGFYYIALAANVPLVMVGLDFGQKRIILSRPFWPTGDYTADLPLIKAFFADLRGKNPHLE